MLLFKFVNEFISLGVYVLMCTNRGAAAVQEYVYAVIHSDVKNFVVLIELRDFKVGIFFFSFSY